MAAYSGRRSSNPSWMITRREGKVKVVWSGTSFAGGGDFLSEDDDFWSFSYIYLNKKVTPFGPQKVSCSFSFPQLLGCSDQDLAGCDGPRRLWCRGTLWHVGRRRGTLSERWYGRVSVCFSRGHDFFSRGVLELLYLFFVFLFLSFLFLLGGQLFQSFLMVGVWSFFFCVFC